MFLILFDVDIISWATGHIIPLEVIISRVEATFQNKQCRRKNLSVVETKKLETIEEVLSRFKAEAEGKVVLEKAVFGILDSRKRRKIASCIYTSSFCMTSSCILLLLLWVSSSCISYSKWSTNSSCNFYNTSSKSGDSYVKSTMETTKALKDALVSNDPVEIKKIRASQSGQLTRKLTQLNSKLVIKDGGDEFDLTGVSEKEIRVTFSAAKIAYNHVCELHERYILNKIGLAESEEDDNKWIDEVDKNYYEVLRLEESYDKQLKTTSRLSSVQGKSEEFERKKVEFNSFKQQYAGVVDLAQKLIDSTEKDKSSTAKIHKDF